MDGEFYLAFKVDSKHHIVKFCHKSVVFGSVPLQHIWVDVRTLYQPGNESNSDSMLSYFWGLSRKWGTAFEVGVQDSYLLARLLPHSRSLGSRHIVPDGRFGPSSVRQYQGLKQCATDELEQLLARDRSGKMSRVQFRDYTAKILEIPIPDEQRIAIYNELCNELFDDARKVVVNDPDLATQIMLNRWQRATRQWGRRSGHKIERDVMDYLSYECRVAFHRCYSAYWLDALKHIAKLLSLGDAEVRFMHLWHLDHFSDGQTSELPFHWFHGHILGLHPATELLMASNSGHQILGDYLLAASTDDAEPTFQRFLNAMAHAIYIYIDRQNEVKQARKRVA